MKKTIVSMMAGAMIMMASVPVFASAQSTSDSGCYDGGAYCYTEQARSEACCGGGCGGYGGYGYGDCGYGYGRNR